MHIKKTLCIFVLSLKQQRFMSKEAKLLVISRLTELRQLSEMYDFTFKQAGSKMSESKMNVLLDKKLEADRQIEILEKVLKELEK